MKGLLHWLLASPLRIALAAAALALSRLFDLFGAALVSLVALRNGPLPALQVIAMAVPVIAIAGFASGIGLWLLAAVLILWAPVLLMSLVLRQTASLALMMQAGAGLVGCAVTLWYFSAAEPMASMHAFLEQQVLPLLPQASGQAPPDDEQMRVLVRLAPAMMAAGSLLIFTLAVLFGRWWQAIAYNPGGFQADFHRLRQGRSAALIVAVLLLVAVLSGHPVPGGFALAGGVALLFQGLAMVHGVVAATAQPAAWLWGMYVLLALLPLPATILLMVAGGVDNWLDFRRRAGQDVAY